MNRGRPILAELLASWSFPGRLCPSKDKTTSCSLHYFVRLRGKYTLILLGSCISWRKTVKTVFPASWALPISRDSDRAAFIIHGQRARVRLRLTHNEGLESPKLISSGSRSILSIPRVLIGTFDPGGDLKKFMERGIKILVLFAQNHSENSVVFSWYLHFS